MKIKSGIVFSQLDIIALYTDAGWTAYINDKAALSDKSNGNEH